MGRAQVRVAAVLTAVLAIGTVGSALPSSEAALRGPGTAAAPPTVSVLPAEAVPSPRASQLPVQITLSAPTTVPVTVRYAERDGTALAGKDYVAVTGTATVPAGARSVTVQIPLLPALTFGQGAADRLLTVVLSAPAGATPGRMSATAAIHPNGYLSSRVGGLRQAVFDPTSRLAYITNAGLNQVEVLNTRTGRYAAPILVGSRPFGIDITADGKELYVCNSGGQSIAVVDVASRRVVRSITTPVGGLFTERPYSIAIAGNGHALFSMTADGSVFLEMYDLTLATGTYRPFAAYDFGVGPARVTEHTLLTRSADRSHVLGVVGNISGGYFFVYDARDGSVHQGSRSGFNTFGALNRDGTVAILDGTYVVDPVTGALRGTVTTTGPPGLTNCPVALNGAGTVAYRLEENALGLVSVPRFLRTGGLTVADAALSERHGMAISPDSRTLVAMTAGGAVVIRL